MFLLTYLIIYYWHFEVLMVALLDFLAIRFCSTLFHYIPLHQSDISVIQCYAAEVFHL